MKNLRKGGLAVLAALMGALASVGGATGQTVALPISGAAYVGSDTAEQTQLLRDLLAEIKALRQDVQALRQAVPPADAGGDAASATLADAKVQAAFKNNCARCHTGDKADGGFELFTDKGELVRLSPADRREVAKRVKVDQMPKPPARLTPADKAMILAAVK